VLTVLFTILLCNVWNVVMEQHFGVLNAAAMGVVTGVCRAPADHALLAAQGKYEKYRIDEMMMRKVENMMLWCEDEMSENENI
jgi:hypothetical protein